MKKEKNKKILLIAGFVVVAICVVLVIFILNHKQNIYKFDFFDGYEPGSTFKGEINFSSGKVDFKIIHGCTFPNPSECPKDDIVKGALNKTQLELVKNAFEKNNRKDNPYLLIGVSYLIKGDKICDEDSNETCEKIGTQLIK